jgi:alpha-N-arabinofuranosidase
MSLDLKVTAPTYKVANRAPLPYLDTSATWQEKSGELYLNVLNRSEKLDISARIDNIEGRLSPEGEVWEMSYPDLKAVHTFGDDRKVRPAVRPLKAPLSGNGFSYTFPKHSLTILKLKVSR